MQTGRKKGTKAFHTEPKQKGRSKASRMKGEGEAEDRVPSSKITCSNTYRLSGGRAPVRTVPSRALSCRRLATSTAKLSSFPFLICLLLLPANNWRTRRMQFSCLEPLTISRLPRKRIRSQAYDSRGANRFSLFVHSPMGKRNGARTRERGSAREAVQESGGKFQKLKKSIDRSCHCHCRRLRFAPAIAYLCERARTPAS